MSNQKSCVYFIELSSPVGNDVHSAQTYIGYANDGDWERRLKEHRQGKGSKMLAYAASVGIEFRVIMTMPGDRKLERGLKNQGHGKQLFARLLAGRVPERVTYTDRRTGVKEIISVPAPMYVQ